MIHRNLLRSGSTLATRRTPTLPSSSSSSSVRHFRKSEFFVVASLVGFLELLIIPISNFFIIYIILYIILIASPAQYTKNKEVSGLAGVVEGMDKNNVVKCYLEQRRRRKKNAVWCGDSLSCFFVFL